MSGVQRPIVIKRSKVARHVNKGGTWKIAYADFMTALMALFLVLWILSTANPEELKSISQYFRTPLPVAMAGGDKNTASTSAIPGGGPDPSHVDGEKMRVDQRQETRPSDEQRRLINLQHRIESVIRSKPHLRELYSQMRMAMIPEGLQIQLVDSEKRPMFELGSDQVATYMRDILREIAPVLNELPNRISLSGHTDDLLYIAGEKGYSNWELSADRANASRRELVFGGLDSDKLLRVSGMGYRTPLNQANPSDPINRRISIVVLDKRATERIEKMNGPHLESPRQAGQQEPEIHGETARAPLGGSTISAAPKIDALPNMAQPAAKAAQGAL